jgi:hypothetical protein
MGLNLNPSMVVRSGISQVVSLWKLKMLLLDVHIRKVRAATAKKTSIAEVIFAVVDILLPPIPIVMDFSLCKTLLLLAETGGELLPGTCSGLEPKKTVTPPSWLCF